MVWVSQTRQCVSQKTSCCWLWVAVLPHSLSYGPTSKQPSVCTTCDLLLADPRQSLYIHLPACHALCLQIQSQKPDKPPLKCQTSEQWDSLDQQGLGKWKDAFQAGRILNSPELGGVQVVSALSCRLAKDPRCLRLNRHHARAAKLAAHHLPTHQLLWATSLQNRCHTVPCCHGHSRTAYMHGPGHHKALP